MSQPPPAAYVIVFMVIGLLALMMPVSMYWGYTRSRADQMNAKRIWFLRALAGETGLLSLACMQAGVLASARQSMLAAFHAVRCHLFAVGVAAGLVCVFALAFALSATSRQTTR